MTSNTTIWNTRPEMTLNEQIAIALGATSINDEILSSFEGQGVSWTTVDADVWPGAAVDAHEEMDWSKV